MNKDTLKNNINAFLEQLKSKSSTKISNVCGKASRYYVPNELYQQRCKRSNRILLPWKTIKNNNLTFDMLKSITGGVVVEFLNDDLFDEVSNVNYSTFSISS